MVMRGVLAPGAAGIVKGMARNLEQQESPIAWTGENGVLRSGADASAWLYGVIPWAGPLTDGVKARDLVADSDLLGSFFDGLAGLVSYGALRYRSLLRGQYREFHLFTGSFPVAWKPARAMRGSDLGSWMAGAYPSALTQRQFAVIGVRLFSGGHGRRGRRHDTWLNRAMDSLDRTVYAFANGIEPDEAFDEDAATISRIMLDSGIMPMSQMDGGARISLVDQLKTWWVARSDSPALPILPEPEHLHFFADIKSAMYAQRLYERGDDCATWQIAGSMPATIFFASESGFDHMPVDSADAMWIGNLLATNRSGGAGALAVSVRGRVEPSKVTGAELENHQSAVIEEEEQRMAKGRRVHGDMERFKNRVTEAVGEYQRQDMPPTLVDLSVAVCAAGDEKQAGEALARVPVIDFKAPVTEAEQLRAFQSMMPCSAVRMTPYEVQWTSTAVSASGVASFAQAGDRQGAILGWTEASRQPCYIGTTTVQDKDRAPFFAILGATGSGKTMTLLHLCFQWSLIDSRSRPGTKTPVVFINPKQDADFSEPVRRFGGASYSMSSDLANGVFDPLHLLPREEAKTTSTTMLTQILDPNGRDASWEINLSSIMDCGIRQGATCCGQALRLAHDSFLDGNPYNLPAGTDDIYQSIQRLVDSQQAMRLIFGTSDDIPPLRLSEGLTLIDAGDYDLTPSDKDDRTAMGRIKQWVLRMAVTGSGAAVRGRDGIVALDEAWITLGSGAGDTIKQWGRLARQWRFMPVLASQKVKEFVDAGLEGFISRGLLLSLPDGDESLGGVSEAKNALRLMGIEDKDNRIRRRMPIAPERRDGQPEWRSLQALRSKDTLDRDGNIVRRGDILRGSVGYLCDNGADPVPIVIDIAPSLFKQISTRATDMDARRKTGNDGDAGRDTSSSGHARTTR